MQQTIGFRAGSAAVPPTSAGCTIVFEVRSATTRYKQGCKLLLLLLLLLPPTSTGCR
jgi:hypothetical protein